MAAERKTKRRLHGWRVLLLTLTVGVLYLLTLTARIYLAGKRDDLARVDQPADVIIVLGAAQANGRPSPILEGRLEYAVKLYRQGRARHLLFTGGRQQGDVYTEAGTGRRYALRHGVPERAILLEPAGKTTMQSLQASAEIMRHYRFKRAILVSDPFHAFRLRRMARDLGIDARVSPTPYSRVRSLSVQGKAVAREVGAYAVYRFIGM